MNQTPIVRRMFSVALTLSTAVALLLAANELPQVSIPLAASLLPLLALCFVSGHYLASRPTRRRTETVKLTTLKATMRTVHLIVNNFFNNLLLIELDLKDQLPSASLDEIESGMQETFRQLKALGDVQAVKETPFAMGALIEYPQATSAKNGARKA